MTGLGLAAVAFTVGAVLTGAGGSLALGAGLGSGFFAVGAAALAAGGDAIFLTGVVTVFFGAGAAALAGILETDLAGPTGFLGGTTGALAPLAVLALAVATDLAGVPGLAFLVLVAFNSCLL